MAEKWSLSGTFLFILCLARAVRTEEVDAEVISSSNIVNLTRAFSDVEDFSRINSWTYKGLSWSGKVETTNPFNLTQPPSEDKDVILCFTRSKTSTLVKDFALNGPLINANFTMIYYVRIFDQDFNMKGMLFDSENTSISHELFDFDHAHLAQENNTWITHTASHGSDLVSDNYTSKNFTMRLEFTSSSMVYDDDALHYQFVAVDELSLTGAEKLTLLPQVSTKNPTTAANNTNIVQPTGASGHNQGGQGSLKEEVEKVAKAIWDAFYVFLALFCACLIALIILIYKARNRSEMKQFSSLVLLLFLGLIGLIYYHTTSINLLHVKPFHPEHPILQILQDTTNRPIHPSLNQSCYVYRNLSAENNCCESRIYTAHDVNVCAMKEAHEIRLRSDPVHNVTLTNHTNWLFYGNSRVRYLYFGVGRIFKAGNNVLEPFGPWTQHQKRDMYMAHNTLPIKITLSWDAFLDNLPSRIERWLMYPDERPNWLFIGIGVNHMINSVGNYAKFGQYTAAKKYRAVVKRVVPALQELSKYIHVTWWTEEYLMTSKSKYPNAMSWNNIDYYNNILKEQLQGTDIELMDAHVPLGELYINSCTLNFKKGKRCYDWIHQGEDANDQYATMVLNHACNAYLTPGQHKSYCT